MVEKEEICIAPASKLCRLCLQLQSENLIRDIFEEQTDKEAFQKKTPLVQQLYDLFNIKYEPSSSLPNTICQRCLFMVETFSEFRENVQNCESALQERLLRNVKSELETPEEQRPGLNGIPGSFEPEDDCVITDVDPEQEYESSDDDFSMESYSEAEDNPPTPPTVPVVLPSQPTNAYGKTLTATEQIMSLPTTERQVTDVSASNETTTYTTPPVGDSAGLELAAKNTYLCQYCDMAFTTQADCGVHEAQHDANAPFSCSFCAQRATSRQNLIFHIKEVHDPERPYVCALCNKGFCRRSDLKKHTIVHTGVRPFTCPVCAKSFSRNTNLTKHMRIHSSVKPHVCQHCPRSFTTSAELVRHARAHSETKPFRCGRCPASFTRKDKLQLHEHGHARRDAELNQLKANPPMTNVLSSSVGGDEATNNHNNSLENIMVPLNPYIEHESTSATDDPYRHSILAAQLQQRHVPPKPPATTTKQTHSRLFTCDICGKTFTRERDLQRHQPLHLDTLFTCKQCGTVFNRREKLVRHEQEHHGPQYPCGICRITFTKPDALEKHVKMHELQQNVALNTQAALNAGTGVNNLSNNNSAIVVPPTFTSPPPPLAKELPTSQRPSQADISFFSQMVPTMNLGFYSETRPEDRNGI